MVLFGSYSWEHLNMSGLSKFFCVLTDVSIPAPSFDLVMARAERCTFRDKSGILVTPLQQQPSHYNIHLDCARAFEPNIVPLAFHVHPDFLPNLTIIHHEYLRLVFGLSLQ